VVQVENLKANFETRRFQATIYYGSNLFNLYSVPRRDCRGSGDEQPRDGVHVVAVQVEFRKANFETGFSRHRLKG
jgi:hypothetical protein